MLSNKYKDSMKIGYIIEKIENTHEEYREITDKWYASEHLSELCEIITQDEKKKQKIINPNSEDALITVMKTIKEIKDKPCKDHGWDDYNRGVIAGQIFGDLTIKNIQKVLVAEELWYDLRFGYYQEVCQYVEGNT